MSAIPREFRPGQTLFAEGAPSNAMYLIKRGTLSIRKRRGSVQIEIARVYQGEVIGEISFFDRMPRSATAVALTQCEVLEIPFDALDKIYTDVPDYLKTIIAGVAERLRKANDLIRRLQRQIVAEEGEDQSAEPSSDMSDAATVLAATAGIGLESDPKKKTAA